LGFWAPGQILVPMNRPKIPGPAVDTGTRSRLVDEAIDRYVEWREECATVEAGYRRWSDACATERTILFAAFDAALDREECAAWVYAGAVSRLRRLLWPDLEPDFRGPGQLDGARSAP
jgi:hypothetical protein